MQNRNLVLQKLGLAGVSVAIALTGCSTSTGGGGGGVFVGDTTGGDGSLNGDAGGDGQAATDALDVIVPTDSKAGEDAVADSVLKPDFGPTDTGPNDTGPKDTGPTDTGPADTGPTTSKGQVWGTDDKSGSVQKVIKLAFGAKTEGCDLDGNGSIDNTLSGLSGFAGKPLQDALDKDSLDMLLEPKSYSTDGTPFLFNVLLGDPAAGSTCKNPSAGCEYTVKDSSYTNKQCDASSCESLVSFKDAKVNGSALTATADKFIITLSLSGAPLELTISKVSLKGTVADSSSWKTTTNGMLCGYITDTDLNAAIDAAPDAAFASIGGKGMVKTLLPTLAPSDISSSGPGGPKDAKSVGMKLETVSAKITGMSP
jgi:hypothetical protein